MSQDEQETTLQEQVPPSVGRDVMINLLLIGIAAAFLLISGRFADVRISEPDPGAAFWPRAVLVVLLIAGLLNLFVLYRRAKRNNESMTGHFSISSVTNFSENQRKYVLAVGISAVFFVSLEWIGFLTAAPLFLFAFAYTIGYRKSGKLAVFSIVVGLAIFFVFRNIMNIALPYGLGPFRELSIYAANLF